MKPHFFNLSSRAFTTLSIVLFLSINTSAQVADTLELVWQDEFEGTTLNATKWQPCPEWKRQGLSYWKDDNYQLTGTGQIRLDITQEGDSVFCGAIRTKETYHQKYGYFEVRCMLPQVHGGWCAFWMMPDHNDPGNTGIDGTEIDIFESINGWKGTVNHALHWDGYGDEHQSEGHSMQMPNLYDGEYHTFGLWWTPTEYVFYIDGEETWRTSAGGVSQVEQYLKLTMEVSSDSWPGNWADQDEKPIHWFVDYVRTYRLATVTATDGGSDPVDSTDIICYPNPSNGILTVSNHLLEDSVYQIINTSGQIISSGKINARDNQIDLSSLPSDVYFLNLGQRKLKIVKCE